MHAIKESAQGLVAAKRCARKIAVQVPSALQAFRRSNVKQVPRSQRERRGNTSRRSLAPDLRARPELWLPTLTFIPFCKPCPSHHCWGTVEKVSTLTKAALLFISASVVGQPVSYQRFLHLRIYEVYLQQSALLSKPVINHHKVNRKTTPLSPHQIMQKLAPVLCIRMICT